MREALAGSFYRPVERDVLEQSTITGLLRALGDPNTDFLTAVEYDSLKSRTARSYSGVGLTVEPSRAGLVVTSALNGPARQAAIADDTGLTISSCSGVGGLTSTQY